MKILYDYMGFSQKVGGVSRCFCELISHLPEDISYQIAIKQSYNIYLNQSGLVQGLNKNPITANNFLQPLKLPFRRTIYNYLDKNIPIFPSYNNINKKYVISLLKESKFDVFHPTGTDTYFLPYIGNKPFVFTVHDMIWELFKSRTKDSMKWQKDRAELVKKASHIIAISENTKKDLINILNVPEEKITVIYHGNSYNIKSWKERIVPAPYFLFVGRRHSYKNFIQTVRDFAEFNKVFPEVELVCTGAPFNRDEQRLISTLQLEHKISSRFVTDEELANLYSHAIGFIFPSLYEGFGLPILEAFSNGCPVLLNNASCFPEIASNAAIYFDSKEGMSNLSKVMTNLYCCNEAERDSIIKAGYERLKFFSWESASLQLAEVYKNFM